MEEMNPSGRETQVPQVERVPYTRLLWVWGRQWGNPRNGPDGRLEFVWTDGGTGNCCLALVHKSCSPVQSKNWTNGVRLKQATNWDV